MPGILDKLNLFGPASQSNPLRGNIFSDAADNAVSSSTAQIPGPAAPTVGPEFAARMMAGRGDAGNAMSLMGVRPGFSNIRRAAPAPVAPQMKFAPSPLPQGINLPTTPAQRSLV